MLKGKQGPHPGHVTVRNPRPTIHDLRPTVLTQPRLRHASLKIGMAGMGEVWARYGLSHNSFLIKYGGMAYRGEGGNYPLIASRGVEYGNEY
jgi:hypothetical protein